MKVTQTRQAYQVEPLVQPLSFKGASLTELWQTVVGLQADDGLCAVGLGVQSPLWSDAQAFLQLGEARANAAMFDMTCWVARRATELTWDSPPDLFDALLPTTLDHGREVTGIANLSQTFALNCLVPVDNAAWLLWAQANGIRRFDEMVPLGYHPALAHRHGRLLSVPMVSYDVPAEEVSQWAAGGLSLLKIKIGSDPGGRGDQEEMLQWDCSRLGQLHRALADVQSPRGEPISYYLDANGRYDSKDRMRRLLDHADRVGALGRILILEEPFPPGLNQDVSDLPVRCAVDEGYHSPQDVMYLLDLGYRCVALKPAAKTLTLALRSLQAAHSRGVPCFVADLTVNPVLLEWNCNVAARLAPLPGMELGILEANGLQNYRDWDRLLSYHPHPDRPWIRLCEGCFELGEAFYQSDGDLFEQSSHYAMMVR